MTSSERPLHVVFLCDEYPPAMHGGVGTMNQLLARRLAVLGQRVTVIAIHPDSADPKGGQPIERLEGEDREIAGGEAVRVIRLRFRGSVLPDAIARSLQVERELRALHGRRAIDVVEGPEVYFGGGLGRAPWQRLIRMHGGHHFFHHAAGRPTVPSRSLLERRSFRRADHLCAVSRFVAEETRRLLRLGDRPIEIIPNPIDAQTVQPVPGKRRPGRIVFAGSLAEKKGVFQLVDAFTMLAEERRAIELILFGRDVAQTDGRSTRAALESRIPPALATRVHFRGAVPRSELIQELQSAEILAYPSHMEALPLAWLEGMSLGKPVLASQAGPGPEVIDHGRTGLLCDPHDSASIADGLKRLLDDAPLRERLGRAAREEVLARFSLDHLAGVNLDYYRRLTGSRGAS